jgi:hypothetical protein
MKDYNLGTMNTLDSYTFKFNSLSLLGRANENFFLTLILTAGGPEVVLPPIS